MHVVEQPPIDLVARTRMAVYALATMLVVSAGVIVSDIVAPPLLAKPQRRRAPGGPRAPRWHRAPARQRG